MRRNGILIVLLLVVPVALYAVYQLSKLNDDEENITLIFQNQLDAILFSVNQYSDDMVSGWIIKMEDAVTSPDSLRNAKLKALMDVNPGVQAIFTADSTPAHTVTAYTSDIEEKELVNTIERSLRMEVTNLPNLLSYANVAGYQKIESIALDSMSTHDALMLYFILSKPASNGNRIGGIVIDPVTYINESLAIRLKTTAQDKFTIAAFQYGQDEPVFSTSDSTTQGIKAMAITKNFWLLPDYYLSIGPKSGSLVDVIRQRTRTNLILLILMIVVVAGGGFLIFRNLRREIQLAQNKSEFVANVSHELRTPLSLITMFAETLEMGRVRSEEKKQEYFAIISKESLRLSGIVNRILNFSHIESDRQKLHLQPLELTTLLREILNTYEYHLSQKQFTHKFISEDSSVWIMGDREAIQEVVINLLDNAIKYSDTERHIEIKVGKTRENGYMAITDHGIGISLSDQRNIFQKFYRVSTGDVAKSKGTGLGLALVKSIIIKHRGRVEVLSQLGAGSTFKIFIPLDKNTHGTDIDR